jgi:hypothetical protein
MLEYSHFVTDVMGFSNFFSNSVSSLLEGGDFKVYLSQSDHPCSCLGFGRIGLGVFPFGLGCHTPLALHLLMLVLQIQ